jgi:uncharacterized protein DUF6851/vanadium-dependent haloperoxidase-like protein
MAKGCWVSRRVGGAVVVVLGLIVALLLATVGPASFAGAAEKKPPPPPKPAKPHGPKSGINFDQWGPSAFDDVVLRWDEQALAEIRATKPGPTVVARALAVVHTAMYDAWAAYDATAVGTRLGGSLRRPADERTADYKSKAISYAAYRALLDLFPTRSADITGFMTDLGYDPADASTDPTTPQGVGNLAAQAVLDFRHGDGANQHADAPGGNPAVRYSDWTGYTPVNTWDQVNDPYRWQPLCVPTPPPGATSCGGTVQRFATPQWGRVTPFALTSPSQFPPPVLNRATLAADAKQLVDIQAKLTDEHKTITYYWADGPGSELPPGHWAMIAQAAARAGALGLDANAKGFFALGNALLDASIATWNTKVVHDTMRPITYIRWLYKGKQIKGWTGPGSKPTSIDGAAWIPYQEANVVTPPFAEYTSGHSAFSGASQRVFNLFAGADSFKVPLSVTIAKGSSVIERGLVPAKNTTLTFKSFTEAANSAGMSRRYGGIHFEPGDLNGRTLGAQIGSQAWAKAQTYFNGTAS